MFEKRKERKNKSRQCTAARAQPEARGRASDKAIQNDPVILEYVKRTAAVAKASPAVFTVVAEYRP
jgi:hypothetical protein